MKNLVKFSFILLLTVISFTSCTKEYTCTCTVDGALPTVGTVEAKNKSQAKSECDKGDGSIFGVTLDCELD